MGLAEALRWSCQGQEGEGQSLTWKPGLVLPETTRKSKRLSALREAGHTGALKALSQQWTRPTGLFSGSWGVPPVGGQCVGTQVIRIPAFHSCSSIRWMGSVVNGSVQGADTLTVTPRSN